MARILCSGNPKRYGQIVPTSGIFVTIFFKIVHGSSPQARNREFLKAINEQKDGFEKNMFECFPETRLFSQHFFQYTTDTATTLVGPHQLLCHAGCQILLYIAHTKNSFLPLIIPRSGFQRCNLCSYRKEWMDFPRTSV